MYISIFAIYEFHVDSRALYEELEPYKMNVTDAISSIFIYGRIDVFYLSEVLFILLKYGDPKITISK